MNVSIYTHLHTNFGFDSKITGLSLQTSVIVVTFDVEFQWSLTISGNSMLQ